MLENEISSLYTVSQVSQFNFNVPAKCMYDTSKTNRELKYIATTRNNFGVRWSQINLENICTNLMHLQAFPPFSIFSNVCKRRGGLTPLIKRARLRTFIAVLGSQTFAKLKICCLLSRTGSYSWGPSHLLSTYV